jgi:hypothetical protein
MVPVRCKHVLIFMGVDNSPRAGTFFDSSKIFTAIHIEISKAINYDTIFEDIFEIFNAKEQNRKHFQVSVVSLLKSSLD